MKRYILSIDLIEKCALSCTQLKYMIGDRFVYPAPYPVAIFNLKFAVLIHHAEKFEVEWWC